MGTLIVHPKNKEQLSVLKAFMKALKISCEETKSDYSTEESKIGIQVSEEKSPYNPKFIEKINQSKEDFNAGKYTSIKTEDLWK